MMGLQEGGLWDPLSLQACHFSLAFPLAAPGMESKASRMLGKCFTIQLRLLSFFFLSLERNIQLFDACLCLSLDGWVWSRGPTR